MNLLEIKTKQLLSMVLVVALLKHTQRRRHTLVSNHIVHRPIVTKYARRARSYAKLKTKELVNV